MIYTHVMSGITSLQKLLRDMTPEIMPGDYVFCCVIGELYQFLSEHPTLRPLATFVEGEGLTLVLKKEEAQQAGLAFSGEYKQITLMVHSSLEAVGLTAAVASQLARSGISANVIAAFYHDHVFVQKEMAEAALKSLQELSLKECT